MSEYLDFDDLELYLAFIKSVDIDYSSHCVTIAIAKPFDHNEEVLRYVESELRLSGVKEMDFAQNLKEEEIPEFYRSAVLEEHPDYELKKGEKVYFFGVDWGSEYYLWHLVAKSCELVKISGPVLGEELSWVS